MSTAFWIQASSPRWNASVDSEATTLDEAVESVFPLSTESAILIWQHVYIPLSYKYDVGTIISDVLLMIRTLLSADSGDWEVSWPSNTFGARWQFRWAREQLTITAAEWWSVVGGTEELLRARPSVEIGTTDFVCEWRALLERVQTAVIGAGYTSKQIPEIDELAEIITKLQSNGVLYR